MGPPGSSFQDRSGAASSETARSGNRGPQDLHILNAGRKDRQQANLTQSDQEAAISLKFEATFRLRFPHLQRWRPNRRFRGDQMLPDWEKQSGQQARFAQTLDFEPAQ